MPGISAQAFRLRPPREDEFERLCAVQRNACRLFGDAYETGTFDEGSFRHHLAGGDIQTAVDEHDLVCGYSCAYPMGDDLYLHLFFVDPAYGKCGAGKLLLSQVLARAETTGCRAVTLITSGSAPWNAPYYEKAGFRIVSDVMPPYLMRCLAGSRRRFSPDKPMVQNCPLILPRVAMERPLQ